MSRTLAMRTVIFYTMLCTAQSTSIDGSFEDNESNNAATTTWTKSSGEDDVGRRSSSSDIYYHGPYLFTIGTSLGVQRVFSCAYDAMVNIQYRAAYRHSDSLDFVTLSVDNELKLQTDLSSTNSLAYDSALVTWSGPSTGFSFYAQDLAVDDAFFALADEDFTVEFSFQTSDTGFWYEEHKFVGAISIQCVPIPPTEISALYMDDSSTNQVPFVWQLESYTIDKGYDASVQQSTSTSTWYHGPFQGSAISPISRISRDFRCSSDSFVIVSYVAAFCGTQYSDTLELLFNGQSLIVTQLQLDAMDSRVSADSEQLKAWDIHCDFNSDFRTLDRVQTSDALSVAAGEVFTIEFKVYADWSTEAVFIGDIQIECSDSMPTTATTTTTTTSTTTTSASLSDATSIAPTTSSLAIATTAGTDVTSKVAEQEIKNSVPPSSTANINSESAPRNAAGITIFNLDAKHSVYAAVVIVAVSIGCALCVLCVLHRCIQKRKTKVRNPEQPVPISNAAKAVNNSQTRVVVSSNPLAGLTRAAAVNHGQAQFHSAKEAKPQTKALRGKRRKAKAKAEQKKIVKNVFYEHAIATSMQNVKSLSSTTIEMKGVMQGIASGHGATELQIEEKLDHHASIAACSEGNLEEAEGGSDNSMRKMSEGPIRNNATPECKTKGVNADEDKEASEESQSSVSRSSNSSNLMHEDHWAVMKVTNYNGIDDAQKLEIFEKDRDECDKQNIEHSLNGHSTT